MRNFHCGWQASLNKSRNLRFDWGLFNEFILVLHTIIAVNAVMVWFWLNIFIICNVNQLLNLWCDNCFKSCTDNRANFGKFSKILYCQLDAYHWKLQGEWANKAQTTGNGGYPTHSGLALGCITGSQVSKIERFRD